MMRLIVVYDAGGTIMAAAPVPSKEQERNGALRPAPGHGQKIGEVEVDDSFSDPEYMARQCQAMRVDTSQGKLMLREK
jgi:hypothetical protein